LLDLIYLTPGSDAPEYLRELRLQNLDRLDLDGLRRMAERFRRPKMARAAAQIVELARAEAEEYEPA